MSKEKEGVKEEDKKEEKPAEEAKAEPVKKEEKVESTKVEPAPEAPTLAPATAGSTSTQAPVAKSNNTWLYVCCGCLGCFSLIIIGLLVVSWISPFGLPSLLMSIKDIK